VRGFRVNMSVPELGQALEKIGAYDGKSRLGIENAVRDSTRAIGSGAKRRVRVRRGKLKKSIKTSFSSNKYGRGVVEGVIAAKQPHAHLIEFGAKAAVVRPRNKKALKIRFGGKVGVNLSYYATKASIPARRAFPFMRPAFEAERSNLVRAIAEAVKP